MEMEKVNEVQLRNVLTTTAAPLQRQLSSEDGLNLLAMLEKAQRRWPNQDRAESLDEHLADYEQLSLKYSPRKVEEALERLRIAAREDFFPTASDVAAEIEARREADNREADRVTAQRRRAAEIAEFWAWAPQWMADTGNSEEELLSRWPAFRGTKVPA